MLFFYVVRHTNVPTLNTTVKQHLQNAHNFDKSIQKNSSFALLCRHHSFKVNLYITKIFESITDFQHF